MFITLKNPKTQKGNGMEQITSKKANGRTRSSRKVACVACQAKKLRCIGNDGGACDRCRVNRVACLYAPGASSRTSSTEQGNERLAGQYTFSVIQETSDTIPTQASQPFKLSPASDEDLDFSASPDLGFADTGYYTDFGLLNATEVGSMVVPGEPAVTQPQNPGWSRIQLEPTPPYEADIAVEEQTTPASTETSISSTSCSCMDDALRIVQQFDDDEFHLTTLSLDRVLQLQKWIIFQCCKLLDCPRCSNALSTHSVLLIICDRLSEMFSCINKRLERFGSVVAVQTSEQNVANAPGSTTRSEPDVAQLFNQYGEATKDAYCIRDLFSGDVREQYSDEEQIQMIQALLKVQIRSFRQLLVRVGDMAITQGSNARKAKTQSMVARLEAASASIEDALQQVHQTLTDV